MILGKQKTNIIAIIGLYGWFPVPRSRFPIQTVLSMAFMRMRRVFTKPSPLPLQEFRDDEVHESGRSWATLRRSIEVRHNDERLHVYQEDVAAMPFFTFGFPPYQEEFTEDDIRAMDVGRRQLKTEWQKTLMLPSNPIKTGV